MIVAIDGNFVILIVLIVIASIDERKSKKKCHCARETILKNVLKHLFIFIIVAKCNLDNIYKVQIVKYKLKK